MSLLDPLLVESNLLQDIANYEPTQWFKGMSFYTIFFNWIMPLFIVIVSAYFLKLRYTAKKEREEQQLLAQLAEENIFSNHQV